MARDPARFRIIGRVLDARTRRPVPRLRVELWDQDRIADDLVGAAETDSEGSFEMTFDAGYFRDLFPERSPDVFARVFDGDTCILDTSQDRTWTIGPGTHEITLHVEREGGGEDVRGPFPFPFTLTSATPLFDFPEGQRLERMPPGTRLLVLGVEKRGYRVERENTPGGWVRFDDLTGLRDAFDLLVGRRRAGPVLDPLVRRAVEEAARERGQEELLASLSYDLDRLEALLGQAQAVRRQDFEGMARFDALMQALIDAFSPPPRPRGFTMAAIRREAAGIDPNRSALRDFRLPCLIDLEAVGLLGSAVYRSAMGRGQANQARVADEMWAGYWILGRLLGSVNRIAAMHHAMQSGVGGWGPSASPPGGRGLPGEIPDREPGWEPGRFPGFPGVSGSGIGCRVEQWERTVRAVRCCGQTYRIDHIETPGEAACSGDTLTISGAGFSDGRLWPFPHAGASDIDPPHIGTPGPFENEVYFRASDGGRVAATEYPRWDDGTVEVVVPPGAVSGPVEMKIFCDRTLRGDAVDHVQCGFETRRPAHDPADAQVRIGAGTLDVEIDGRGPGRDGRLAIEAEACTTKILVLRGRNLDWVRVTREGGEEVASFEELGGGDVLERVTLRSARDESYVVTMRDLCGDERSIPVEIERYRLVTPEIPSPNFDAATTRTIPVTLRLSCDPAELDLESVAILLGIGGGVAGVTLREPFVRVEAGSRTVSTNLDVAPFACGRGTVRALTFPPAPIHRSGDTPFQIIGQAVTGTFSGTASVLISDPRIPPMTVPLTGVGVLFSVDRSTIVVTTFPPVTTAAFATGAPWPCETTAVIVTLASGGTGAYGCGAGTVTGLGVTLRFDLTTDCAGDSSLPLVFTTGTATSRSFSATGSPIDGAGNVTLVGAGIFSGGWLGGTGPSAPSPPADCLITLTGTITPVPPPCCGS